jgi:hypothetical protein
VGDLGAIGNAVALIAEGDKDNKAILNEDIPAAAMGCIAILETKELSPTRRLPRSDMAKQEEPLQEGINLAKVVFYSWSLPPSLPKNSP